MNWAAVVEIFKKDLQETTKNRYVFLSVSVLPIIIIFENVFAVNQILNLPSGAAQLGQILPVTSLIVLLIPSVVTALLASTSVVSSPGADRDPSPAYTHFITAWDKASNVDVKMGDLCDLLFELSSEERIGILRMIGERRSKLTSLARELQITNQECSRHISRLASVGLVAKEPDGVIKLTPYASQVLTQLRPLEFSTMHRDYFLGHTIERIPPMFQMRLGELSNSQLIDDVMVVFKNVERMYMEAEEYVLRVTDRLMITIVPYAEKAFERGVKQRLLDPVDIVVPPDYRNTPTYDEALRSGQFVNHTMESCDFFLAMSEKGVALPKLPPPRRAVRLHRPDVG